MKYSRPGISVGFCFPQTVQKPAGRIFSILTWMKWLVKMNECYAYILLNSKQYCHVNTRSIITPQSSSVKHMNEKWPLAPPLVTLSTTWCHMGALTLHWCSSASSMMSSGACWASRHCVHGWHIDLLPTQGNTQVLSHVSIKNISSSRGRDA